MLEILLELKWRPERGRALAGVRGDDTLRREMADGSLGPVVEELFEGD